MTLELHPEADAEFAAQVDYYENQQTGLGQRFYREVFGCFEWIVENSAVPRLRKNYRRVNLKVFLSMWPMPWKGIWFGFWRWHTAEENLIIGRHG